jgi:predicted nucleic acid-binding protein
MVIVVDTGVLYALADRRDSHHAECVRWLVTARGPLVVPPPVIAEACYLIGRHLGAEAEASFLDALGPGQPFVLGDLVTADVARMSELVRQYADLPLGGTDAAVIAVAERLGAVEVATVDRRHFSVVRPKHVAAFMLVPELGG